jgi:membrane protein insertase Oxa1/YidC/SpoIIIJ
MQVSMPDVKFSDLKPMVAPEKGQKPTEDMMQTFQVYMKYGLPVMIFFMAFGFMASLTLYWITSNLFMIFQERMVRGQKNELKKMN